MRKIPIELVERIEQELPDLVDAVQQRRPQPIILLLDDFEGQADLLYDTLWYVASHGRQVVIESDH